MHRIGVDEYKRSTDRKPFIKVIPGRFPGIIQIRKDENMKKLSYQTLKELNYDGYLLESAPERVLQFGEGNFLRAFVDYFIDKMNEMAGFNSKVVVCQPQGSPLADIINEQEGAVYVIPERFSGWTEDQ